MISFPSGRKLARYRGFVYYVEVDAFFTREGRITGLCIAMNKRVAQAW